MRAVVVRARAEIGGRWRALLALGLVVGLGGGFVLASATGARRTDTVLNRFLASTRAADVEMVDDNASVGATIPSDKIISAPEVEATSHYVYFYVKLADGVAAVVPADDKFGRTIDRYRIIDGRAPIAADEAAVSLDVAQRMHLGVGSEIPLIDFLVYFQPTKTARSALDAAKTKRVRIVGVEVGPGELPPTVPIGAVGMHMSSAFLSTLKSLAIPRLSIAVRLKDPHAAPAFLRSVGRFGDTGHVFAVTSPDLQAGTSRSFHLQSNAFWLLAALIGLVACLIFEQGLSRQASLESLDVPTLRALGMGRGQVFAVGMARAAAIASFGIALALVVGFLLTTFSPIGLARIVDPHRGFFIDGAVLALGAVGVGGTVLLLAAVPTWRAAGARDGAESVDRSSRWTEFLTRNGSSASMVAGGRLAFQRGRGRTAVPVRSSLAGSVIGLAALVASLCFGAGLIHLIRTPGLYGWRWDYYATTYGLSDLRPAADLGSQVPGIRDIVFAGSAVPISVDNVQLTAFAVVRARGDALPPIIEGRAPSAPGEIVLGSKALRAMHKHIGDTVQVQYGTHTAFVSGPSGEAGPAIPMRVVGRGVFPAPIDPQLGFGAMLEDASFAGVPERARVVDSVAFRFAPGADRQAVLEELRTTLLGAARANAGPGAVTLQQIPLITPDDVLNFGQVRNLPLILAGLLAILAAATLAHTMMSSIHRRARDLAILKTLGFVRGQIRALVAWQALFLALATLLVGVPLGVVAGRWAWTGFADRVGVVPVARVPLVAVLLCIPATVVLANLLGVWPARSAARTRPAIVLRTE